MNISWFFFIIYKSNIFNNLEYLFLDLCDDNDPDVDDVSDILGLCSGKFATQIQPKADLIPDTQQMCSDGAEVSKSLHLETQDTLILTG